MDHYVIRRATVGDAADIARIYNHYIETSTATFDTELKSVEERQEWIAERSAAHPVVVVQDAEHQTVAWGSLSPFASRSAWSRTVEVAVYVAPSHLGQGIGPLVLDHLVHEAVDAGHHVAVSKIVSENEASLRMTERAGFERVGVMREVGRKFDRWLDVVIMQRVLPSEESS